MNQDVTVNLWLKGEKGANLPKDNSKIYILTVKGSKG